MMNKKELDKIITRYMAANFTINRRMTGILRDAMPNFITHDQYSVLQYMKDKDRPVTSSELADSFCVGKSTVTAFITRLENKRLLDRIPDQKDRRVTWLQLTEEGSQITLELQQKICDELEKYLVHFADFDPEQFLGPFERLAKLLVQPDEGGETEA